ncbi:hypothetical protein BK657_08495 [Pseudomonas brassicacearum]|nr:hypothetical protein BK656_07985 [Pseudomonas brassicacearum]RON04239.1 hypothetical protein BK657_08495 [Pseudomonas brassicacearum]
MITPWSLGGWLPVRDLAQSEAYLKPRAGLARDGVVFVGDEIACATVIASKLAPTLDQRWSLIE